MKQVYSINMNTYDKITFTTYLEVQGIIHRVTKIESDLHKIELVLNSTSLEMVNCYIRNGGYKIV